MRRPFLPFLGLVFLSPFLFSAFALGSQKVFSLNFDPQDLAFEKVERYDRVRMVGAISSAEPGAPLLPMKFVQIAIPYDLEVERVEVTSFEYEELPGTYKIYPAQPFYPLSSFPTKEKEVEFVEGDLSIYELSSEYPGKLAQVTNNGFLGGQHIAGVALYPLQYIPAEGKLVLYAQIEFRLIFQPSSHSPAPVNRRSDRGARFYSNLAKSKVINPEAVQLEAVGWSSQDEEVEYLIITDGSFVSTFQELADWKILKGISTEVKDVSWVFSNYPGYDDQEKIRNCIKDFYSNFGTRWVLLGGDTEILPHRSAWVATFQEGDSIPSDLYYSDLDGDWDANGNRIYGEYEDAVDMYPDVFVGRSPSNNISQAQTFVNKCLTYEMNPPTDYQTKILYAAEMLWPETDAAELKNYIDSVFVPDHFQATKLYETSENLNRTTFGESLNQGQNIINHNGHGNYDRISIGPEVWYSSDMDSLTNAPRFSLFYTFGCVTAAIDADCIAEHFINNPDGGGFAYCGNTRSGWGIPGEPLEGPGAEFDIEFFRALFDSANYQAGKTLANSKIPLIPIAQQQCCDGPYYRWTMFTLLLLGEPTLELWTNTPAELSVSHDQTLPIGMTYIAVNVAQDSALVSCVKDREILGSAFSSGGSALVYFDSPPLTVGTMLVTVTKHDYLPYRDTVLVIPPEGPCVIYHSHQINDSQGNNNGAVNPNETIYMPLTVKNIGLEAAYGVNATLREEDDYIVLTDSVQSFGDIDSGMTALSLGDYSFEVDASCPDSHLVQLALEATDGETSWVTEFFEMVAEPDFVVIGIPDTAVVHRGDTTTIKLVLQAFGGFNLPVSLTHTPFPPGVDGFFYPDQFIPTDTTIFTLYATPDAPLQIHPLTITAVGGEIIREREIALHVMHPAYYGSVWHVSTTGDDLFGSGSDEFPFRTIQKGIETASHEDTVLVERGRYMENINFLGKPILVTSHFIFDHMESTIESTVIDGSQSGSVVTFDSREDSNSIIRGFTLTNGYATYGGGIYCMSSSPSILNNLIVENECVPGKGGPAIYLGYGSDAKICRNLIANCTGPAAVFLHVACDPQLVNNTVCDNGWGGMSVQSYSGPYVKNNIISNNSSYGIEVYGDSSEILYNDVYGSEQNYVIIPDQTGINGNISADPLFADPPAGNYHLTSTSPCVDAGDPTDSVPLGGGIRIDMGAFEYAQELIRGDANGNGAIGIDDVTYLINYLFINGSAPDPIELGDANCDGLVDTADVMRLINYLFLGGSSPGC